MERGVKPMDENRWILQEYAQSNVEYLYKYSAINDYLVENLAMGQLYFSDPRAFNDLYDCGVDVADPYAFAIRGEDRVGNPVPEGISWNPEQDALEVDMFGQGQISKTFNQYLREQMARIGVTCFSRIDNGSLLWAHYGNAHRGICLEFAADRDRDFFCSARMNYVSELKPIEENQGLKRGLHQYLYTKSQEWSYEEEQRIWVPGGAGLRRYEPQALTGLIFGHGVSVQDYDRVMDVIRQTCEHRVDIYRIKQSYRDYSLFREKECVLNEDEVPA